MTLPEEDRHIMSREHLEDSLCMRMGGRVADSRLRRPLHGGRGRSSAQYGARSTNGARVGHVKGDRADGLGLKRPVFLGEDLMHTRDYSDHTSKVIDDEIERILREQESRAIEVVTLHRRGLEALARALLEHETIDGAEAAD